MSVLAVSCEDGFLPRLTGSCLVHNLHEQTGAGMIRLPLIKQQGYLDALTAYYSYNNGKAKLKVKDYRGKYRNITTSPSSNHFNREDLSSQRVDRNLSTSTTSSHDFRPLEEREDRPIGSQYGIPRIDQDRVRRGLLRSSDQCGNAHPRESCVSRESPAFSNASINGISLSRNSNTGMGLGRGDELPLALGALSLSSPVRRRESSPKAPPKWKLESKTSLSAPAGQRSKYPDPVSGAPSNFQQRLAELSVLEQDTIRYERTKKSKRKAKQDRDS
ncbi:Hypp1212 [Branchiostoma lanceolatum]|uniref:Hypp1212 protein n=1 Tax=Branchiostoma lanceolatum TaxID=7740 RepID=A0A8J9ZGR3_BRALA|nr:Hypp1212 [Branchiostoma lanceolatum]